MEEESDVYESSDEQDNKNNSRNDWVLGNKIDLRVFESIDLHALEVLVVHLGFKLVADFCSSAIWLSLVADCRWYSL